MIKVFLSHQWKNFRRAKNSNKSLAVQIIIGIFYLLIFLEIAGVGILLPYLIQEQVPGKDPAVVFCSYILYYFFIGILARIQFQGLPTLSIQPYLTQNIKRSMMLRFLNIRSLIHIINFLPLFIFLPFTIITLLPVYGPINATCFFLSMYALVFNNHFITMYLKRRTIDNSWWFFGIILLIAALKGLDYFHIFSFSQVSSSLFMGLLQHPIYSIIPFSLAICSFFINNQYLRNHLYIEELSSAKKKKEGKSYAFLNKLGSIGDIMELDIKLLLRNKRPRSFVIMSVVILLYGFMFYPKYLKNDNVAFLFFWAVMMTGIFISGYGRFLFSWQSSHFDGMMSYNLNMKQYIKAKFLLFLSVSTLQIMIASFYGFMSLKLIPIQLAAFFYNVGVNSFLTIYIATYNYKYLSLSKSSSMNFQGVGGAQWLQSLMISLAPLALFFVINRFFGFWPAIIIVGGLGITGLTLHEMLITKLAEQFNIRKHKILEGFRER